MRAMTTTTEVEIEAIDEASGTEPTIIGAKVIETDEGYAAVSDGDMSLFTNWVVEPVFHIAVDGDDAKTIFEVELDGSRVQMPSELFDTVANMRKWCHSRSLGWSGTQTQLEGLFDLIANTDVPRREGVTSIGLHDGSFVLPDEVIGEQDRYINVESDASPMWNGATRLEHGEWDPYVLQALAELHKPEVMTILLGWVAVAPLRSLCAEFPPLAVLGGPDHGKTTLIKTALDTFGFWIKEPTGLNNTSQYAVSVLCESSNALPVWVDEWRASTGKDEARRAFAQIIRDSWNGGSGFKGGGGDNRMGLRGTTARAPLIISGEGQLSEKSHLDRCVIVQLGKDGKNVKALRRLHETYEKDGYELARRGLGRDYLGWLQKTEPKPPSHSSESGGRNAHGLAVVRYGYGLLEEFVHEWVGGGVIDLPRFDPSAVIANDEAERGESILVTLLELADHAGRIRGLDSGVFIQEAWTFVNVERMATWYSQYVKDPDLVLPGGGKTIREMLKSEVGAVKANNHLIGSGWKFKSSVLWD